MMDATTTDVEKIARETVAELAPLLGLKDWKQSNVAGAAIGERYGISQSMVSQIVRGGRWS